MANPIVILLNILALAGSLFHAFTYFNMMPQVMPIQIKGKKVDKKIIILAQWAVVAVISVVVLALV